MICLDGVYGKGRGTALAVLLDLKGGELSGLYSRDVRCTQAATAKSASGPCPDAS
jgi:hypothetical protein